MWALRLELRALVRGWRAAPTSPVVCIVALASGIGANTTLLALTDAVFVRAIRVERADSVFVVGIERRIGEPEAVPVDETDLALLRGAGVFESVGGLGETAFPTETDDQKPDASRMVSAELFDVLSVRPTIGGVWKSPDALPRPVLISHGLWRQHHGGTPDIVGRTTTVGSETVVIAGVMPAGFSFPWSTRYWAPASTPNGRRFRSLIAVARLSPTSTTRVTESKLAALAVQLGHAERTTFKLIPLRDFLMPAAGRAILFLTAASLLMLLAGSGHVAAAVLRKAEARRIDFATRIALGASPSAALFGLFLEAWILWTLSAAVAVPIALTIGEYLRAYAPTTRLIDPELIDFFRPALVSLACALGAVVAAWVLGRPFRLFDKPATELSPHRRAVTQARNVIIGAQLAVAVTLAVIAAQLTLSFANLKGSPLGFDPARLYAAFISPATYRGFDFDGAIQDVTALSGVESACAASFRPLEATSFLAETDGRNSTLPIGLNWVGERCISTLRGEIIRGREFDDGDTRNAALVAIANDTATVEPYGFNLDSYVTIAGRPRRVVGIIRNIKRPPAAGQSRAEVYLPASQFGRPLHVLIRAKNDHAPQLDQVREVIHARGGPKAAAVTEIESTWQALVAPQRAASLFLSIIAAISLALTCLGLYESVVMEIHERRKEIAIRQALGATPVRALTPAMFKTGVWIVGGVLVGFVSGVVVARLNAAVFGVPAIGFSAIAAVAASSMVLLALIALLAAQTIFRRAPASALRSL